MRYHYTVEFINCPGDYVGLCCLAYPDPVNKCIEAARGILSSKLQNTPGTTESTFLLTAYIFDELGYLKVQGRMSPQNKRAIQFF